MAGSCRQADQQPATGRHGEQRTHARVLGGGTIGLIGCVAQQCSVGRVFALNAPWRGVESLGCPKPFRSAAVLLLDDPQHVCAKRESESREHAYLFRQQANTPSIEIQPTALQTRKRSKEHTSELKTLMRTSFAVL